MIGSAAEVFALGGFQMLLGFVALLTRRRVVRGIVGLIGPKLASQAVAKGLLVLATVVASVMILCGIFVVAVGVIRVVIATS
jgi:hypothetical protein